MAGIFTRLASGFQGFMNGFSLLSPGEPMKQTEPPGTPPTQFQYPVGYNFNNSPRFNEPVTFGQLRALADNYDLLRLAIETRKDQMEALVWNFVPIDKKDKTQADNIQTVKQLFRRPDKFLPFRRWLRMMLEDVLVIDAPAIYIRRTRGKDVYSFDLIDGATIKRNLDTTGRTPAPPLPAYQQILYGIPAIDLTTNELLYMPRNQRTHKIYGYGNVEQIIMTVNIAIRRQLYQLGYYTEGNIPEAFISCPESWGLQQVIEFQAYWDSLFVANPNMRRRARFIPNGTTPTFSKENPIKDMYDEWLARIISYCFSLPPTPLVKETNRATAQTTQDAGKAEGLAPLVNYVKEILDILIQDYAGFTAIQSTTMEEQAQNPLEQAQVNQIYVTAGVLTPDEVREDLGREPLTEDQKAELNPPSPPPQPLMIPATKKPAQAEPDADPDEELDDAADKIAKTLKKKGIKPLTADTPKIKAAQKDFAKKVSKFFDKVKPGVIKQIMASYQKHADADPDVEKLDGEAKKKVVNMILDELNFDEWSVLFDDAVEALSDIAQYGAYRALGQVGVSDKDITKLVDEDAVKWAQERSAELVGMKYIDGELVENPNPKWPITDSTRDYLRGTVSNAVEEGWSPQKLAKEIADKPEMWDKRADTIAKTELGFAHTNGNLIGWKNSGVVSGKRSLCMHDEDYKGDDPCPGNADAGVIPIDDVFPSGDDGPPYHPNCVCALVPVVGEEEE
jgi:hypothetical protein